MSIFGRLLNRTQPAAQGDASPGGAVDVERRVEQVNRWRDQLNPLRGITMATAVSYLEQAQRGEFADVQWAYSFLERRDADLLAIVERRTGALLEMDWDIKTVERRFKQRGVAFDAQLAADQQAMLRGSYDGFSNLYGAIEALAMATFRGFAHVQFLAQGHLLKTLNPLDQWNVVRDGLNGAWFWNPSGRLVGAANLSATDRLNPAAYVTRVCTRPVNEIAIIKYLRQNLSAKDWDAFLEIYGIPGWIVTMPDTVPAGKEDDYRAAAQSVAEGGSGALPAGATATCADQPRGVAPFRDHMTYWTEKLVLAGTGGLLTMLSMPQGIGSGASGAHGDAFALLARSEARRISELFQRSIDAYLLARHFPGRPALAYFAVSANEEQDVGQVLDHATKIVAAGGQVDWSQISEKTGYRITAGVAPSAATARPLVNRESVSTYPTADSIRAQLADVPQRAPADIGARAYVTLLPSRRSNEAPLVIVRLWELGAGKRVSQETRYRIVTQDDLTAMILELRQLSRRARIVTNRVTPPKAPAAAAAEPADANDELAAAAALDAAKVREAQLEQWMQRLDALQKRDMPESDFLAAAQKLVAEMPGELLTRDNIAALAEPLEAAMGSAVVNALITAASEKEAAS